MGIYTSLKAQLASGKNLALVTVLEGGPQFKAGDKLIVNESKTAAFSPGCTVYPPHFEPLKNAVHSYLKKEGRAGAFAGPGLLPVPAAQAELFVYPYAAPPRLIILGGGHVGAALNRLATELDFEVVVIDDRPEFASALAHPQADRLICAPFEEALEKINPGAGDYIVIVTRGHRHDLGCLKKVLTCNTAYTGMIGSRKRVAAQMALLKEEGFSPELLQTVHAPIGLDIGAVTEPEIAISILAQIIKTRRSLSPRAAGRPLGLKELVLLEGKKEDAVLATVLESRGSSPGKTGAQLLVYQNGTTLGTIGGGSVEKEVISKASGLYQNSSPLRLFFNLDAAAGAAEGMACGGTMQVYLELLKNAG